MDHGLQIKVKTDSLKAVEQMSGVVLNVELLLAELQGLGLAGIYSKWAEAHGPWLDY